MTDRSDRMGLDRSMESEVRALYRALIEGWNRRNAGAMARLFAEGGNVVGFDGSQVDGPPAIEATMAQVFDRHPTLPFVTVVREVRRLGPGTALLRAVVGMTPPGKSELDPALNAIQSMVAVRAGDRWRIALFQNTPAAFHGRPELVAQMTEELRAVAAAPEKRKPVRRRA
jgi:uncharacterized protein (TIGR02246 family)